MPDGRRGFLTVTQAPFKSRVLLLHPEDLERKG